MRKYLYRFSLLRLSFLLLLSQLPLQAQTLALAQQAKSLETTQKSAYRLLSEVLAELRIQYRADILFEPKTVEGIRVNPEILNERLSLEQNLASLLIPLGLNYKKINRTSYTVVVDKKAKANGYKSTKSESDQAMNWPNRLTTFQNTGNTTVPSTKINVETPIIGIVTAFDSNEPLPGVSVVVKGTQKGTTTSADGTFRLIVPDGDVTLVFSFVGYLPQEVQVGSRTRITVSLSVDTKALDEVVVIGYGSVKKSDLTGSVSSLKMDELNKVPVASITQSLAGRTSGVRVTSESGAPGAGVKIRIRGTNSLQGDNDPLYVIDGIPIATNISGSGNFSANALAGINPNDIESMEILKDASAVAIYGSRGANGVVLITTKSGKKGKSKVAFDQYAGVQQELKQYDVLNGREFTQFRNLSVANSANPAEFTTYSDEEIQQIGEGTNWRDQIIQTAPMYSSQLSFSGGTDKLQYYLSGNRFSQDGVIKESGFKRGSFKGSLTFDVSDRFKVGTDFTLSQSKFRGDFGNSQNSSYGGGYIDLYLAPPTFPIRNPDGTYFQINPLSSFPFVNPVENALEIQRNQTNLRGLGNVFGEYEITTGLKLKVILGADYSTDNIRQYAPTYTNRGQNVGTASQSNRVSQSFLNTNTISYNKSIDGVHNVSGVLGYETQTLTSESFGGGARKFSNDNTGYYSLESGQEITNLNSDYSSWGLRSYLGRLNYNYDNLYFLTVTGRYDGSSKFQGDNKYSFFPSVALAWRVGNESFFKNVKGISDMKLRASYGQTGSQAIPPYQTLDLIGSRNNITINGNNTTLGYYPIRIPSPNLSWETTTQYDAGLDLSLLAGRLSITADYFFKRTDDLLLDFSLPFTSGFNSILQNRGAMQNKGFEFTINSNNINSKDFSWNTNFNISFIKNKVLDLGGRDFVINTPNIDKAFNTGTDYSLGITKVGQPLGTFFVLQEDGIIDNQQELDAAPFYASQRVGARKYLDINGDGIITADDRKITGNAQPVFAGGIMNNLEFRGFDLSAFFEFVYGNELFNATRYTLERNRADGNITRNFYENYWRGEGTSTTFPAPSSIDNLAPSNSYVEDGSFLRLRNLSIGYSLPRSLLQKAKLGSVRLYVNATNIWTLTKYSGLDPDTSVFGGNEYGAGIDYSAYPSAKTYVAGISLEF